MTIVAESYRFVVGVDTHAATNTLAVLDAGSGHELATATFPTSPPGVRRALAWIGRHTQGATLLVVEGIGSYGAGVTTAAARAGYLVVEPFPTPAGLRRGQGKSDRLDATRIAGSVRGTDTTRLRQPRCDEPIRQALRVLLDSRDTTTTIRTRHINQLTALLRSIDLGIDARHPLTASQIRVIAAWRTPANADPAGVIRTEATRLARHIVAAEQELADNLNQLRTQIAAHPARFLLGLKGVGPVTAAAIIVAWSHPGRVRSDAAFASLAGVAPIPASSGNTIRYRLNRGGDRRLNRAITTIVRVRLAHDPRTRAYRDTHIAQGKTPREIERVLKRYIARDIYRQLTAHMI